MASQPAWRALASRAASISVWLVTMATQPSWAAMSRQPGHRLSSSSARGRCGAVSRAPCRASGRKELSSGGTAWPAHSLAACSATTRPVIDSWPGVGLISMLSCKPLARMKRASPASVGNGSPAWARLCQLPASSCDSADHGWSPAVPWPLVVRSSVASCSRKGTPSADSLTSHSKAR